MLRVDSILVFSQSRLRDGKMAGRCCPWSSPLATAVREREATGMGVRLCNRAGMVARPGCVCSEFRGSRQQGDTLSDKTSWGQPGTRFQTASCPEKALGAPGNLHGACVMSALEKAC